MAVRCPALGGGRRAGHGVGGERVAGQRSIRQVRRKFDYRVMVPKRTVTPSGIPELVGALFADARDSVARHLP